MAGGGEGVRGDGKGNGPVVQLVQRIYLFAPQVHGVTYNGLAYANLYTAWLS